MCEDLSALRNKSMSDSESTIFFFPIRSLLFEDILFDYCNTHRSGHFAG